MKDISHEESINGYFLKNPAYLLKLVQKIHKDKDKTEIALMLHKLEKILTSNPENAKIKKAIRKLEPRTHQQPLAPEKLELKI